MVYYFSNHFAGVLELADETDSNSVVHQGVWVRVPPPAPQHASPAQRGVVPNRHEKPQRSEDLKTAEGTIIVGPSGRKRTRHGVVVLKHKARPDNGVQNKKTKLIISRLWAFFNAIFKISTI